MKFRPYILCWSHVYLIKSSYKTWLIIKRYNNLTQACYCIQAISDSRRLTDLLTFSPSARQQVVLECVVPGSSRSVHHASRLSDPACVCCNKMNSIVSLCCVYTAQSSARSAHVNTAWFLPPTGPDRTDQSLRSDDQLFETITQICGLSRGPCAFLAPGFGLGEDQWYYFEDHQHGKHVVTMWMPLNNCHGFKAFGLSLGPNPPYDKRFRIRPLLSIHRKWVKQTSVALTLHNDRQQELNHRSSILYKSEYSVGF